MNDPFEILFVAFCGVVLTFAFLFVACWCLVSCSFFCLKYFYCGKMNTMISGVSLASISQSEAEEDDSSISGHEDSSEEYVSSSSGTSRSANPYFVENLAETGCSETGKVWREDIPPKYDFPPPYHTLFPNQTNFFQMNEINTHHKEINTLENKSEKSEEKLEATL